MNFELVLQIILVVVSVALVFAILLHKGRGGGMSDMFGGGVTSGLSSSGVAERNLNRLTVTLAVVWGGIIIALGIMSRFSGDF
ncbi:preprotein translocase subunit SecG [Enteractinococcus coprophilus]|uniref:Protein-export membrane protein SecG n=1 Tax=Enteractinococcus coprophilus TaxID=1027633 RepID=A0A543AJ81_9MICC|nr:preprotein translocase subunit SecG [Enteractinococcus coprophilus]TQL72632.1 protein translocase subunit secG [Enteractinococcus coprophilus]